MRTKTSSLLIRATGIVVAIFLFAPSCEQPGDDVTLTAISPAYMTRGQAKTLTVTGSGFVGSASRNINCGDGSIIVDDNYGIRLLASREENGPEADLINVTRVDSETITGELDAASSAILSPGLYDVEMISPDGSIALLVDALEVTEDTMDTDSSTDSGTDSDASSDSDSSSSSDSSSDSDSDTATTTDSDTGPGTDWIADYATVAHVINGTFDSGTWNFAPLNLQHINNCMSDNTVLFSVQWDETSLYFALQVIDEAIVVDSPELHDDDGIEIFIDGDNSAGLVYDNHDNQFVRVVDSSNLVCKAGFGCGNALSAIVRTTEGYSVEMAVPWVDLGVVPHEGLVIGMDMFINDDDDGGTQDCLLSWSGDTLAWEQTQNFIDITLGP